MSEVAKELSERMRRSFIPVREVIHSSDVSNVFSSCLLSNISGGTYPPIAVIEAVVEAVVPG